MMKIDRLLGITIYLLNHDLVSARRLAEKFEVSQRTIQRDIASLNLAGIPIVSLAGTQGGYRILDRFQLNRHLSNADDYMYVITALKALRTAYENNRLELTIDKILHHPMKKHESQARLFLDLAVLRENPAAGSLIKLIESAMNEETAITFQYTNANNHSSHPVVEPIALTYKWYAWYLLGYCTGRKCYRLYKLLRMEEAEKTGLPFSIPHLPVDQLLAEQEKADSQRYAEIKLRCKADVRLQVLEYLKGQVIEEEENGDLILALHVPANERMWFSLLLGFGAQVTVLEPPELRDRLREKAAEILRLYRE